MSDNVAKGATLAASLRSTFDQSFAAPHPPAAPPGEDFLQIRAGTEPYALRLLEIAGLFADRKVTPLPGSVSGLLGIAGFRGVILPVYDLAPLLGRPSSGRVRWLATAVAAPVSLAFDIFEGHRQAAREAIVAKTTDDDAGEHIRDFVRLPELGMVPVVHLPSVLAAIRRRSSGNLNAPNLNTRGC